MQSRTHATLGMRELDDASAEGRVFRMRAEGYTAKAKAKAKIPRWLDLAGQKQNKPVEGR